MCALIYKKQTYISGNPNSRISYQTQPNIPNTRMYLIRDRTYKHIYYIIYERCVTWRKILFAAFISSSSYMCKYNYRQWEKFIRLNTIAAAIKFTLPPVSRSLCTSPHSYTYKFVLQFILIHFSLLSYTSIVFVKACMLYLQIRLKERIK